MEHSNFLKEKSLFIYSKDESDILSIASIKRHLIENGSSLNPKDLSTFLHEIGSIKYIKDRRVFYSNIKKITPISLKEMVVKGDSFNIQETRKICEIDFQNKYFEKIDTFEYTSEDCSLLTNNILLKDGKSCLLYSLGSNRKEYSYSFLMSKNRVTSLVKNDILLELCKHLGIFSDPSNKIGPVKSPESLQDSLKKIVDLGRSYKDLLEISGTYTQKRGGRIISSSLCYQGMPRYVRYFLAEYLYHDIDMRNSHPTILSVLARKANLPCKYLLAYANNRDNLFSSFIEEDPSLSKEELKKSFLICIYKKVNVVNFEHKKDSFFYKFLVNYIAEVSVIGNILLKEKNNIFSALELKEGNNHGSIIALICQMVENHIIMSAIKYLTDKGYIENNIVTPVFDGLMIPRYSKSKKKYKDPFPLDILESMSVHIERHTGFYVLFEEKVGLHFFSSVNDFLEKKGIGITPLNIEDDINSLCLYIDDLSKKNDQEKKILHIEENRDLIDGSRDLKTAFSFLRKKNDEVAIANHIINQYRKTLIRNVDGLVLFRKDNFWVSNQDLVERLIKREAIKHCEKGNAVITAVENIKSLIFMFLEEEESNFLTKLDYYPHTLPFKDMYLNLNIEGDVQRLVHNNYSDFPPFFSSGLPCNYNDIQEANVEDISFLKKYVLEPILGKEDDKESIYHSVMSHIAKGIFFSNGKNRFIAIVGSRDSGKSFLQDFLIYCLGDLCDSINSNSIMLKKEPNSDADLENRFLIKMANKRVVFASEFRKDRVLDGTLLKKICGGDEILARNLNSNYTYRVKTPASFVFICNEHPKSSVPDFLTSLNIHRTTNVFVSKTKFSSLNEEQRENHYVSDPDLKSTIYKPNYRAAMLKILVDLYLSLPNFDPVENESSRDEKEDLEIVSEFVNLDRYVVITKDTGDLKDRVVLTSAGIKDYVRIFKSIPLSLRDNSSSELTSNQIKNYLSSKGKVSKVYATKDGPKRGYLNVSLAFPKGFIPPT